MARPTPRFNDFIGQKKAVTKARRQARGAQRRGEPMPSTAIIGPSGVGKNRFAQAIAAEFGTNLHYVHGTVKVEDLARTFLNAKSCDVLFIDEAHNLRDAVQEVLLQVIDQHIVPVASPTLKKSKNQPSSSDALPLYQTVVPVGLILATDQPGKLKNALLKRMELMIELSYYPVRELTEISQHVASQIGLLLTPQAARAVAKAAVGLPRRVEHLLRCLCRDFPSAGQKQIGLERVRRFLRRVGIDQLGLAEFDRKYLLQLARFGRASLQSLALAIGTDINFVKSQIEPVLSRLNFINIGSGGRTLSNEGKMWIEKKLPTWSSKWTDCQQENQRSI
jgi:Holliday junction resolvasome RuvABC ATP-dependent DNA helicase subunit